MSTVFTSYPDDIATAKGGSYRVTNSSTTRQAEKKKPCISQRTKPKTQPEHSLRQVIGRKSLGAVAVASTEGAQGPMHRYAEHCTCSSCPRPVKKAPRSCVVPAPTAQRSGRSTRSTWLHSTQRNHSSRIMFQVFAASRRSSSVQEVKEAVGCSGKDDPSGRW